MSKEKQEKGNGKPDLDKVVENSRRDFIRKVTIAGAVTIKGAADNRMLKISRDLLISFFSFITFPANTFPQLC
jgi:hypothetical protein